MSGRPIYKTETNSFRPRFSVIPFGDPNDIPRNCGVKHPKNEILGPRIGLSSVNNKKLTHL